MTYICLVKQLKGTIMKILFTEFGDENMDSNGTTFHYGVVTIKGEQYDFSLCEMYDSNSDSSSFEVTILEYEGEEDVDDFVTALEEQMEADTIKETYLCESEDFVYFRDEQYNASVMYRKSDNKKWEVEDVVDGELINDVVEGNIIKLAPTFIYNYQEILKQNKKSE